MRWAGLPLWLPLLLLRRPIEEFSVPSAIPRGDSPRLLIVLPGPIPPSVLLDWPVLLSEWGGCCLVGPIGDLMLLLLLPGALGVMRPDMESDEIDDMRVPSGATSRVLIGHTSWWVWRSMRACEESWWAAFWRRGS